MSSRAEDYVIHIVKSDLRLATPLYLPSGDAEDSWPC